jgi:hypothetical protein
MDLETIVAFSVVTEQIRKTEGADHIVSLGEDMEQPRDIENGKKAPFDYDKEYVALRSEILDAIKEARSLERYVIVTVAGLWAWMITHKIADWRAWLIPFGVVCVACVRAANIMQHLGTMGEYIRENLEPIGRGYEHFLYKKRGKPKSLSRFVRTCSDYGSWVLLLSLNIVAVDWGPTLARAVSVVNCPK